VEGLADHGASMNDKDQGSRVELEYGSLSDKAKGNLVVNPSFAGPKGDQGDNTKRRGCGETFKVFCFAIGVFGHRVGRDVVASEAKETTESKRGEEEVVKGRAHTNGDRSDGRGDTERDLESCQHIADRRL
jgi:hypothetical protein